MACVTPEGHLSALALSILYALKDRGTPEGVAERTGFPLFKIRSGLREMQANGLVRLDGDQYVLTEAGKEIMLHPG